jgi:hypothetical protein
MTARSHRDPRTPWVKGTASIAAYLDMGIEEVGAELRAGNIRGHQRKRGGVWRSHILWLDAYLADEEPPRITSSRT